MTNITSRRNTLWPERWWWIVLAIILLIAGALRYTGYDFSLPYVDHPDEPNHLVAGQMIIDQGTAKDIGYHAYPPGLPTLSYIMLRWFHDPALPPTSMVGVTRLISITLSLASIALIALLAYRAAPPTAGLFAAFLWAISPMAVEYSRFATPDIFVAFFSLLALFAAVTAVQANSDGWGTGAAIALIAAVAFKYQAGFIAPVILLLPLWRIKQGEPRREILTNVAWNTGYFGVYCLWLVTVYPMLEANDIPNWVAPTAEADLPSLSILLANIREAASALITTPVWIPALLGLLTLLWKEYRRKIDFLTVGAAVATALLLIVGVSIFGRQPFRQMIGANMLIALIFGVGLAGILEVIETLAARIPQQNIAKWNHEAASAATSLLVLALALPAIRGSIANAREHTLPDRRNDLAAWADATLTPGDYIGSTEYHKVFNPAWGGYRGQTAFRFAEQALPDEQPIDVWREQEIEYAIVPYWHYEEMQQTPEGQAALDEMLLLKEYPPSDAYRGPAGLVFHMRPMQHEAGGSLGPIHLLGYDIDRTQAAPGESITFRLYWRAEQPTDMPYTVYNHLTPLDTRDVAAQVDGPPLPGSRTTTGWADPQETLISAPFVLNIDEGMPPGEYRLLTGFYQPESGQRLTTASGEDHLVVTIIEVRE